MKKVRSKVNQFLTLRFECFPPAKVYFRRERRKSTLLAFILKSIFDQRIIEETYERKLRRKLKANIKQTKLQVRKFIMEQKLLMEAKIKCI